MTTATLFAERAPVLPTPVATAGVGSLPLAVDDLVGARDSDLAPEVEGAGDALTRDNALGESLVFPSPSTLPPRDFFHACHTVAPPAPYVPAFGPHRGAHLSLAAVVAGCVFSVEGRV